MNDNKYKKIEAMLYSYNDTKSAIKNIMYNISYYKDDLTDIKAVNYDDKIQSNNKSCLADAVVEHEEKMRVLHKRLKSRELQIKQVDAFIECLNDEERKLIKYKYMDKHTQDIVAEKLNISISALKKRNRKIIERAINIIF